MSINDHLNYYSIYEAIIKAWEDREDFTSVIFKKKEYSFRELIEEAEIYSKAIKDMGINSCPQRIVLISKNNPQSISLMLACAKLGWLCCPLNYELKPQQLILQIKRII